jgi:hypothetical protein
MDRQDGRKLSKTALEERWRIIIRMKENGGSPTEIAAATGCSRQTIYPLWNKWKKSRNLGGHGFVQRAARHGFILALCGCRGKAQGDISGNRAHDIFLGRGIPSPFRGVLKNPAFGRAFLIPHAAKTYKNRLQKPKAYWEGGIPGGSLTQKIWQTL